MEPITTLKGYLLSRFLHGVRIMLLTATTSFFVSYHVIAHNIKNKAPSSEDGGYTLRGLQSFNNESQCKSPGNTSLVLAFESGKKAEINNTNLSNQKEQHYNQYTALSSIDENAEYTTTTSASKPEKGDEIELASAKLESFHILDTVQKIVGAPDAEMKLFCNYYYDKIYGDDRSTFWKAVENKQIVTDSDIKNYAAKKITEYVNLFATFMQIEKDYPSTVTEYTQRQNHNPTGACNPACDNIGFENGTLSAWSAYYAQNTSSTTAFSNTTPTGGVCGSVQSSAYDPNTLDNQVTLMTGSGLDPVAGSLIPIVCPTGGSYSCRIGDSTRNGAQMGILEQSFNVTPTNANFTYMYAVVLENPGHTYYQQPYFNVQILDQNGNPVVGCGNYSVVSGPGLPGYTPIYYPNNGDTVYCKPWTTVFVPLQAYIGQCVTLKITTSDCELGGHFGYAYFDATCSPGIISSSPAICGNNVTLSAPSGAATYSWSGPCIVGSTTAQSVTVSCAGIYKVAVTSISGSGCSDTIVDTVRGSTPPVITILSHSNVTCNGGTNGNAVTSVTGGTSPFTYSWTPGGNTQANPTNLSAGTYTVTVTDATGCKDSATVTIIQPPPIIITINPPVPVSCNGGNNGSASVNASGGASPYKYSWAPAGGTSSSASNLIAGIYTITVTDANNCSNDATVTIAQPTALASTVSSVPVSCNNGNNGTATDAITGGTPPYLYAWAPSGGYGSSASNLTSGTYTVIATDANNCKITSTVTVTEPTAIATSLSSSGSVCNGGTTGTATVIASGGTSPYTYSWAPYGGSNYMAIGLSAGNYTVTTTDAHNCQNVSTIVVTQPPLLTTTPFAINTLCNGNNDGSAKVVVSGGVSPYSFAWTPPVSKIDSATNLSAGIYAVVVTDAHNCSSTVNITVAQPNTLTAVAATITNVSCNGGNNGSVSSVGAGGTLPYSYVWTPTGGKNNTANNLTAGTYTITITDAHNCTATANTTITEPPALNLAISSITNVSCYAGSNGAASVSATGGTGAYKYSWLPNVSTYNSASGLKAGSYVVTVTDANNCTASATIIITQPTALTGAIVSHTNISCAGGNNGSLSVTAAGGTPNYTYAWSPNVSSTSNASNLTMGSYTITITDNNGCTDQVHYILTQPQPLITSTSFQKPLCNGQQNGSATVTVNGGVPSYSYVWGTSPKQFTATATNVGAGTYTVQVTDANGCSQVDTVTVTQPSALGASVASTTNPICYGDSTGSVSVYVTGGTVPYTYSWNTVPVQTNYSASKLPAGSYSVTVFDANNCPISASATLTQPTPVVTQATAPDSVCSGTTVTITASATGGTGNYNYQWSTGSGSIATQNVTPANATTYTVMAVDGNGCKGTVASVSIYTWNLGPANVSVTPPQTICHGDTVSLYANVTNGNSGNVNIQWSNGYTGSGPYSVVTPTDTTFTINVTNQCGSTVNKTITVKVNPLPVINIPVQNGASCNGVAFTYKDSNAANAGDNYFWSFGDGATGNTNPITHTYGQTGTYSVTVVITTPAGCSSKSTAPASVTVYPTAKASFTADPTVAPITDPVIHFQDSSFNTSSWQWDFGDHSMKSAERNPTHRYGDTGKYLVQLVTNNTYGCPDTAKGEVRIIPEFTFFVPNAFSPNGDGLNEYFTGKGIGIAKFDMVIYDRWGMFIFESQDINKGWDGTVNGGNKIAQEDTYVYIIKVTDIFGQEHKYLGSVTLIK